MKHHFKAFFVLLNFSFKRYLEHRWNTVGNLISPLASLIAVIFFIQILYSKTPVVLGWDKYQLLFFTGAYQVFSSLYSFLVLRSINFLPDAVQRGELDLLLTKPLSSQFLLSFRLIRAYEILNVLPGIILMWYAGSFLSISNWPLSIFSLALGLTEGLVILYGLYFSLATLSFWLTRFSAMTSLYALVSSPLAFPLDIFGKAGSFALTFIIPLGFMLTIPVKVFLGKSPQFYLVLGGLVAIFFLSFSIWFWNLALRHYTSASS